MVDSDGLFLGADVLNHFVQELRIALVLAAETTYREEALHTAFWRGHHCHMHVNQMFLQSSSNMIRF